MIRGVMDGALADGDAIQSGIDYFMRWPGVTAVRYSEDDDAFVISISPPLEWITIDFSMTPVTGAEAS